MSLAVLEREITQCTKCAGTLSKYGVVPRPIFGGGASFPVVLIGQAPGKTEYERNAPFQGDAGKTVKALFSGCGVQAFERVVYQTSVTKCFPGRREGSSTDRMPSVGEVKNCASFLSRQLELVKPRLIVCLGGLSWKALLTMIESDQPGFCQSELNLGKPALARVPDLVGNKYKWRGIHVLPMIHPAGSANGSRAEYPDHDRRSKDLLRGLLLEIGAHDL